MNLILKLAWRNIWRNKKRSFITILSVLVAVLLAIFTRSMQLGMYSNMIKNVVNTYTGFIQIHKKGYWDDQTINNSFIPNEKLLNEVKSVNGVVNIIPRLQTFSLMSSGKTTKGVLIQGVDIEKEQVLTNWNKRIIKGKAFAQNEKSILISKGLAGYFKKKPGDTLVFVGQGYHGMTAAGRYTVAGIVDMKNPKLNNLVVFFPLKQAQEYCSAPCMISQLVIAKDENTKTDIIAKELKKKINTSKYEIMQWGKMIPELKQAIAIDNIGGIIMIAVIYMIISFGILGTVLMMTEERIYELGVMLAVGTKKIKLMLMLTLESILLSLTGVIAGIILITPIVYYYHNNPILLSGTQGEAMKGYGFEPLMILSTDWHISMTHAMIIFVISLIAALYPIMKIYKLKPVEAMKEV